MKIQINPNRAAAVLLPALVMLSLMIPACKGKEKDEAAQTAVNPAFERNPPSVKDISIQQLKDDKNGNVKVVADFGNELKNVRFHAINAGDEKLVLRDDGKKGDEQAGDGRFTIVLNDDLSELQSQLEGGIRGFSQEKEFVSFNGRTLQRLPIEKTGIRDFASFKEGKLFKIPPFLRFPCTITPIIKKENSLMVTDPAVVQDVSRTFNPCTSIGNPDGVWAFPRLIAEMANQAATGVTPKDFLMDWLKSWQTNQTVNSDVITARTQIANIINTWSAMSGGTFDIKFAPFKLIAIVNRVDLRGSLGYGLSNPGEGRFVFCAINCNGGNENVIRTPAPFMVIFEYGLPFKKCAELKDYAGQWASLSGMTLGSPAYNKALEKITEQFAKANSSPSKPNGSSLNQIRTNELAIGNPWELREFNIDSVSHKLKNVTVKQEPQIRFNRIHPANVPADVQTMAAFVNTNTAAVEASTYSVPEIEAGKPFLAGKAHTLNAFNYHWDGNPPPPAPAVITSDSARFIFSLNTCSGCHGGEANTGNFMHVAPGGVSGVPAVLSGFLKGNPPMSSGGFIVNDRALRPAPPGKPREFNDLERRKLDLARFVSCPCVSKSRTLALLSVLQERPVNMTH